ncbi:MAG TPA: hypothetical protein VEK32_04285 [Thermodesulfobacteriota bacterium]|nr:hypothetical protein [Thermodesulfobacteriota bacterium]
MNKRYYLLEVEGGVEPIVRGPYRTKLERDNAAKQMRLSQQEDDGLFWADIDEVRVPAIGTYTAGFFWEDST